MKKFLVLVLAVTFLSCKSKQALVASETVEGTKSSKDIAEGHYKNIQDFKTLQIRSKVDYKGGGESLSLDADVRIKKGEMIIVSISVLGFPVAKGQVTPKGVSYYNKMEKEYFEGNFEGLTELLKIDADLNYEKVENMLLGKAMNNLKEGSYKVAVQEGLFRLLGNGKSGILNEFLLDGNYLLKQQKISEGGNFPRHLSIAYPAYYDSAGHGKYPTNVNIEAQDDTKVNIDVEYKSLDFNKEGLKFSYSIPEGLDKITID